MPKNKILYLVGLPLIFFLISSLIVYFLSNYIVTNPSSIAEIEQSISGDKNDPELINISIKSPVDNTYIPKLTNSQVNSVEEILLTPQAATALERLFSDAANQGINLTALEGYVSYDEQTSNIIPNDQTGGAENFTPGSNDHQSGLSVDVSSDEIDNALRQDFALTNAYNWLQNNMARYGFILRYPQGKEDITGQIYMPWHLRYVGVNNAKRMSEGNICLEEYLS